MGFHYDILKQLPVTDNVFEQAWLLQSDIVMKTAEKYDLTEEVAKGVMKECVVIPGMTIEIFGHTVGFLEYSYEKEHLETFKACVKNSILYAGIYVANVKPTMEAQDDVR